MRRLLLILLATASFLPGLLDAAEPSAEPPPGVTVVDAKDLGELAVRLDRLTIIDARLAADRRQGYIEDSVSLPNVQTRCDSLARVIPSHDHPVVFYCNGIRCGRSREAAQIARGCGFRNVYWFRGGFEEWLALGYPYLKE